MKKLNLFVFLLLITTNAYSQKHHLKSSADILKIMEDSKLRYSVSIFDSTVKCNDYSDNLNENNYYRIISDSGIVIKSYDVNPMVKSIYDKALDYYQARNIDSAIQYYKLAVNADSSLSNALRYIGVIYKENGDNDNAILWFKKAVNKNYIDFMAHWFLAEALMARNTAEDLKNAVDEITIALIFDRNNAKIKKTMKAIFEAINRNTEDWCFNPQIQLRKISDKEISVGINEAWTAYAFAKAVWTYEPGYRESKSFVKGQYSILEDRECILQLRLAMENQNEKHKKIFNEPQFKVLKEVINETNDTEYLDEYIFYETILPQKPSIAFQLPQENILKIKDYILNIRHKKI